MGMFGAGGAAGLLEFRSRAERPNCMIHVDWDLICLTVRFEKTEEQITHFCAHTVFASGMRAFGSIRRSPRLATVEGKSAGSMAGSA